MPSLFTEFLDIFLVNVDVGFYLHMSYTRTEQP